MPCSAALHILLSWVALVLSLRQGEGRPRLAQDVAPHLGQDESQRGLLLEAVRSSMGTDQEHRPSERASEAEFARMHQLYRETVKDLRRNISQGMGSWRAPSSSSTVLLPATVKRLKVLQRDKERPADVLWYRAVFHKNQNIRKDLTTVRAQLQLYRKVLDDSHMMELSITKEVHIKIYEPKSQNSSLLIHKDTLVESVSVGSDALTMDIKTEVDKWRRRSDGRPLVVEVGLVSGEGTDPNVTPQIVLEVDLIEPRSGGRRRQTRSNREDICDEDGHCCRKSVNVSFKEIGWSEWVVAPASYKMYFCDGSCPHNFKPASMHAQVKSRLYHINKGAVPRPCCVPAAFEPMILMHYDSRGKLKLTPFNDLIVSKCHCA
ncbi:hypothetical protein UPYG_G00297950 [Umbra pygmaea]|uniref:TGF-beta family profile domain-containing protein n=1 Tax=Umbra pygmaea TaxID=75934 RepID=A0ABD0W6V8_UMBPY